MSCCKNDLGSFPHNQDIDTGLVSDSAGVWRLHFTGPNFSKMMKPLSFSNGEAIVIPQGILNEDCLYSLILENPSGVNFTQDDCENFVLTTYINKIACEDVEYL